MQSAILVFLLGFSFLMGSVPFGFIIARLLGAPDPRKAGSGNIGATNMARVVGPRAAAATLVLDLIKGMIPVFLSGSLPFLSWISTFLTDSTETLSQASPELSWACGFLAVAGHCFSPWIRFRGGKGVATGLGVVLMLSPIAALVGVVSFVFTFFHKRIGSLSSLIGILATCIAHGVLLDSDQAFGAEQGFGFLMVFLILARHESNIDALLSGTEKPFERT